MIPTREVTVRPLLGAPALGVPALGILVVWIALSLAATLDAACADLVLLEPDRAGGRVDRFLRARGQVVAPMGVRIGVRDLDLAQGLIEHNTGCSLVRYDIEERAGFLVPPERTSDVFVEFVQD